MTDVKRTAMQVALDAEAAAQAAMGEAENATALASAAVGGDGGGGAVVDQMREQVALLDGAVGGHTGTLTELVKDVGTTRTAVQKLIDLMPGNLWAGRGGALATQEQVGEVHARLEGFEAGFEAVDADVLRRLATLEDALSSGIISLPQPASRAPHVLGLIAQLQKLVHEIGKGREFKAEDQRGAITQQYSFRGIDEAQNAIGSAQREIGLIGPKVRIIEKSVSVTTVDKGSYTQLWTSVSVTASYTFQSPVDGSEWTTEGCGMGRDMGDKAESKALAGAFKYALFHGLNIPVKGVFVDAETEDPRIEREREQDTGRTHGHGQAPPNDGDDPWSGAGHDRLADERRAARALDNYTGAEPPSDVKAVAHAVQQDTRSLEELAVAALAAARRAADLAGVNKVVAYAQERGIMDVHVDGGDNTSMPLRNHLMAIGRLAPRGEPVPR